MPNWTKETTITQNIAVLLFPRFSNMCLANAVEPLRAANEILMYEAYNWNFVTIDGNAVTSSSGLPVLPNSRLRDHSGGDFLFVVSSYDVRELATPEVARALSAASKRFKHIVGMDTGAWLLAHAGLLDKTKATIHWAEFTSFLEQFDTVKPVTDRVVVDGNRITSGGAMAAFDTATELIRRDHGEALKLEVSAFFLHQTATPPAEPFLRKTTSPLVDGAVKIMSENLETPVGISDIADRLGVTQRSLSRVFNSELGAAPKTVYKWLRLAEARRHVEQTHYSISEIALRCGYLSPASMTRAFVQQFGKTPSDFRRSNW